MKADAATSIWAGRTTLSLNTSGMYRGTASSSDHFDIGTWNESGQTILPPRESPGPRSHTHENGHYCKLLPDGQSSKNVGAFSQSNVGTMANNIKGNRDAEGGRNETYRIPGRGSKIPRGKLVKEVEKGKHPLFSIYTREGKKYVRSNPNSQTGDNVDE